MRVVEVGPRDGLQNEPAHVPVEAKVNLIEALADAGCSHIECGSFVSPRRVPQMSDSADVFARIGRHPGTSYSALVPNVQGLQAARAAQVTEVAVFVSASEAFSQANLNASIEGSLQNVEEVIREAQTVRLPVRGYVSCALGCPFQGDVPIANVVQVATRLQRLGCYEVSLGDTIGVGTPVRVQQLLMVIAGSVPLAEIAVHFHDTYGQALANILASLELGIAVVDSSVAGLGGCPFAPGATGNVATEDVLYMLAGMNIHTGIDLPRVAAAGRAISQMIHKPPASKVALALQTKCQ